MFQVTMCQSSGATSVFMRHLVLVILCGWLSGYLLFCVDDCPGTCYSVWMTVRVLVILCGWLSGYLLFCVDDCLGTCYSVWMTARVLVILCGWLSGYLLFCVDDCLGTCYSVWMTVRVLVILCGWLSGMQGGIHNFYWNFNWLIYCCIYCRMSRWNVWHFSFSIGNIMFSILLFILTNYLHCFYHILQPNADRIPSVRSRSFPSSCFPIHYSAINVFFKPNDCIDWNCYYMIWEGIKIKW